MGDNSCKHSQTYIRLLWQFSYQGEEHLVQLVAHEEIYRPIGDEEITSDTILQPISGFVPEYYPYSNRWVEPVNQPRVELNYTCAWSS